MLDMPLHPFVCFLHPSPAEFQLCSAAIPSCALCISRMQVVLLVLAPASVSSLYTSLWRTGITAPASLGVECQRAQSIS